MAKVLSVPGLLILAGCQGGSGAGYVSHPSTAVYRCGGSALQIEHRGSMVRVRDGSSVVELPAAPPGSRNRFGTSSYALVLEDREALWMVSGKSPRSCRR